MKNKQIIVLGRGRSGTSIVAGLLDNLGVNMGLSRPAGINNPKGYFEDVEISSLLDKYIDEEQMPVISDINNDFEKEFKKLVKSKSEEVWGWKQPKTLYLLPIIIKHLENPYIIVCNREMEAHIKSINSAFWGNRKSDEWCRRSIEHYQIELKKFFEFNDCPRLNVHFEDFMDNNKSKKIIKKICEFVGIEYNLNKVKDFISPKQSKYTI